MPILLGKVREQLRKYRPGYSSNYPVLGVTNVTSALQPLNKNILYKGQARSESGRSPYPVYVQIFDVITSPIKTEVFFIPNKLKSGKTVYSKSANMRANRVSMRCMCQDSRFNYEAQMAKADSMIGNWRRYKRKTKPLVRPANPVNPNPKGYDFKNPKNYYGYCKHLHSFFHYLNRRKLFLS